MEIALQGDSRGIHYEGYDKDFRQCIFEESDVHGKNERYEFRCTPDLECCGRICCVPVPAVVPLWLIILFLILGLILLAAVLGTLAWLWAKRKPKKEPFVPSPMTVEHITAPKPSKLQKHEEDEISRASQAQTSEPAPLNPQRAQIAYYRSAVDQVPSYNPVE